MAVIKDYEKLRQLALEGIKDYFDGKSIMGDRDGIHHGEKGKRKASLAQNWLNNATNNPDIILATLRFIFSKPTTGFFDYEPGRSSRLSSLIAEKCINGESSLIVGFDHTNTLKSEVVDLKTGLATNAKAGYTGSFDMNISIPNDMAGMAFFDHTRGMRQVIHNALMEHPDKLKIANIVQNMHLILSSEEPINLDIKALYSQNSNAEKELEGRSTCRIL